MQARAGAITASRFADATSVLTRASGDKKAGDTTAAADKYATDLAMELISGQSYGEPVKAWTLARGHELEPMARIAYEARTGNIAEGAGIAFTDDKAFGYSTDGLVNPVMLDGGESMTCDGLIEIKCPVDSQKILAILQTGDLAEYQCQMQGGMWITGAKWCDFIMYVPDLEKAGRDLYVQHVLRDDASIADMERKLMLFLGRAALRIFAARPTNTEVIMTSTNNMLKKCAGLVDTTDVTDWENKFLQSVWTRSEHGSRPDRLSAAQVETLETIHEKHFAS